MLPGRMPHNPHCPNFVHAALSPSYTQRAVAEAPSAHEVSHEVQNAAKRPRSGAPPPARPTGFLGPQHAPAAQPRPPPMQFAPLQQGPALAGGHPAVQGQVPYGGRGPAPAYRCVAAGRLGQGSGSGTSVNACPRELDLLYERGLLHQAGTLSLCWAMPGGRGAAMWPASNLMSISMQSLSAGLQACCGHDALAANIPHKATTTAPARGPLWSMNMAGK